MADATLNCVGGLEVGAMPAGLNGKPLNGPDSDSLTLEWKIEKGSGTNKLEKAAFNSLGKGVDAQAMVKEVLGDGRHAVDPLFAFMLANHNEMIALCKKVLELVVKNKS